MLVVDDAVRVAVGLRQRPGDEDALTLAAGETPDAPVRELPDPYSIQRRPDRTAVVAVESPEPPVWIATHPDDLLDGDREAVGRGRHALGHVADSLAVVETACGVAKQRNRAVVGAPEADPIARVDRGYARSVGR